MQVWLSPEAPMSKGPIDCLTLRCSRYGQSRAPKVDRFFCSCVKVLAKLRQSDDCVVVKVKPGGHAFGVYGLPGPQQNRAHLGALY